MSHRIFNFSAGPAMLPTEVLEKSAQALLDYQGKGFGIAEVSHRGKEFDAVADEAIARCKQLLGLEDPANRLPKAVERTAPMALILYSLVVVWFHQTGHGLLQFPFRPWYPKKEEPSFADMLTTLRRISYEEKAETLLPKQSRLKTWIAQLTELLGRAG